jgi:uncharacterized protein (TIGR01777 family)
VSGSSGLVGTALVKALADAGHRAIPLVRRAAKDGEIAWDPRFGKVDTGALEGVDAVVHLAGAGIGDHRWTDAYKGVVLTSRTVPTSFLARTLAGLDEKPGVFVSASAVGYYGDRGDEELDETSAPGTGFLSEVCLAWEAATAPAEEASIRVARVRSGLVLSGSGGALKKQLPLFKLGLGGRFGSGRQWQSWITLDDEVGAIIHLLTHDVAGAVNLTTPNPVTNATFAKTLGSVMHRPALVPIPALGPRLVLGRELVDNLLFSSQRALPHALEASGYRFAHVELADALESVLS